MKKIGGVVVSHGQVANELVAAAETVVGDLGHIAAVSIGWHDDVESAKNEIARAIKRVSQGERCSAPDGYVRRHADEYFRDVYGRQRYRNGHGREPADGHQTRRAEQGDDARRDGPGR
ncbi:MAG: hypothetical protein IPJ30_25145 [Acidobacteria bacterium]|nr:hypothetical protein [Acidobacteriota bacterium]